MYIVEGISCRCNIHRDNNVIFTCTYWLHSREGKLSAKINLVVFVRRFKPPPPWNSFPVQENQALESWDRGKKRRRCLFLSPDYTTTIGILRFLVSLVSVLYTVVAFAFSFGFSRPVCVCVCYIVFKVKHAEEGNCNTNGQAKRAIFAQPCNASH